MSSPTGIGPSTRLYVAGHTGLVGSAICRELERRGYSNLALHSIEDLDLADQAATRASLAAEKPEALILAAARVGGILANWEQPYEFIADNLAIELNVVDAAFRSGVRRLIFLGSSCIYPREAPQPLKEEYLLTGPLEPTNEAYAVAKIAGITMCRSYNRQYGTSFLAAMPTNLYGPNDNFNLETSHVLPALIRKFHEAKIVNEKSVVIWGTGTPYREFLHVDDLADATLFLMNLPEDAFSSLLALHSSPGLINIGTEEEVTIRELALLVKEAVGYGGDLAFDTSKPDGTPRKLMDSSLVHSIGWKHRICLRDGLKSAYEWYLENKR